MKSKDRICLENYIEAYKSRLKNNNLDLHMVLYSCNHCFEFNPYTKEIRPFNSIFWYNLDKGTNENKYQSILEYLKIKYEEAKEYPTNPIGLIIENTLAVDMNDLMGSISNNSNDEESKNILNECDNMIKLIEEMYSNWSDIMMFVLNNYKDIDKIAINNYWRN